MTTTHTTTSNRASISDQNRPENYQGKQRIDWSSFFGGLLVVLAGIIVIYWPGLTLEVLATIAGIVFLIAAVVDIVTWWRMRNSEGAKHSGWTLLSGICDAVVGVMFLVNPIIGAGVLTFMAGIFIIVYGCFALVSSFGIRNLFSSWWIMLLNGIVSILCGMMFIFNPAAFAIFLGVFLMMRGITMATYSILAPRQVKYL